MVNMIPVTSSNVASVGYEQGILYVKFHSGATYSYDDVSQEEFESLQSAQSVGSYFNENIKNQYAGRRV
jgi:hypothetical protein